MANESNNKEKNWEVAGHVFKAESSEDALKYAQQFFAGPDGSGTDGLNLTLADIKRLVALPPSEPQSVDPERLRQFDEINDALTLCTVRFHQLDTIAFNLRLTNAPAEQVAANEAEQDALRVQQRELSERLEAWIREGSAGPA